MELNPYISGALSAIVYFTTNRFLPKKIQGIKRGIIAIAASVIICLIIRFIIDLIAEIITSKNITPLPWYSYLPIATGVIGGLIGGYYYNRNKRKNRK
ncbi:MAG: hypothetical protein K2L46_01750 [Paramuribaculum sp.]|nr:hypothetical protein [Paramuribaculum sp.]MDE6487981.1 hypothetical protein [Paramuribaculum sp.]